MIFTLSSCGFRPVYSESSNIKGLNNIEITQVNSVEGAELYHQLSSLLPLTSDPQYRLIASTHNTSTPLVIQKNSDTFRQSIAQKVQYQLYVLSTGKLVTSGEFVHTSSYNTTTSPYVSYVEESAVRMNLIKQAAEKIRTRLILFFENNKV